MQTLADSVDCQNSEMVQQSILRKPTSEEIRHSLIRASELGFVEGIIKLCPLAHWDAINAALMIAASIGNVMSLRALLPYTEVPGKERALWAAAKNGRKACLQELLRRHNTEQSIEEAKIAARNEGHWECGILLDEHYTMWR